VRRKLAWTAVVLLCVLLCAAAAVVLFVVKPIQYGDLAGNEPVRVDIPTGATLGDIAARLHRAGVVRYPIVFRQYAAFAKLDRNVRPGEYEFVAGEAYRRILDRLRQGDILQVKITFREGLTRWDIAALLEQKLGIPRDEFLSVSADPELRRRFDIDSPTLEGYLFPDTYFFPTKSSAKDVVHLMLLRFFAAWSPQMEERARAIGMTRAQVLTLASIIESEAQVDAERPRISAVYHNRLRREMLLQADPTVLYALGGVRRRVLYSDLMTISPYNTYLNRGLPPGPICNPGLVSIEAALAPTPGNTELFFVAAQDGTGRHIFTATLGEHEAAKRRAERLMAERAAAAAARAPEDSNPPVPATQSAAPEPVKPPSAPDSARSAPPAAADTTRAPG
jgi:UPF0755 protein